MVRKRLSLAGAFILVAGLVALCFWILPRKQPPQTVTLADGSTVTFVGVDYGKKTFIVPNGSWANKLAFLPDSLLKRLKINPGPVFPVESNHLAIWFRVVTSSSMYLFDPSTNPFSLVDENGVERFPPVAPMYNFPPANPSKGYTISGLDLGAFPRRAEEFRMRFYSKGKDGTLSLRSEMKIPNPAYRTYPQWRADPLPVTKTNVDVTITLAELSTGLSRFSSGPARIDEAPWGAAIFTFAQEGKPIPDWAVDTIVFSDATSNRLEPAEWGRGQSGPGEETFKFRLPLWSDESAWKLNATFKRRPEAKFAPGELWSITNIPLPALDSTNVLNLQTNLSGLGVALYSLADESGQLPAETLTDYHRVRLNFQFPPLPAKMRIDVLGVAGNGDATNTHPRRLSGMLIRTAGADEFTYLLPASAGTMDVKVAIYRLLTAEFVVKPTSATGNNSNSKSE